jgi:hypothetical protein
MLFPLCPHISGHCLFLPRGLLKTDPEGIGAILVQQVFFVLLDRCSDPFQFQNHFAHFHDGICHPWFSTQKRE